MVTVVTASMLTSDGETSSATTTLRGPVDAAETPTQTNNITSSNKRSGDNRRINKPIMEKRRRARINNSLNDLKVLVFDAMKRDPARQSKLEKADILEMAVKHIEKMQRQQVVTSTTPPATSETEVVNKFRAGFTQCTGEVSRFPGLDTSMKKRLLSHLDTCLRTLDPNVSSAELSPLQPIIQPAQLQVHILQNSVDVNSRTQSTSETSGVGLQLVPTRLSNGDIALVLPAGSRSIPIVTPATSPGSHIPMLVPIPQRTASTASASSAVSSTSAASTSTSDNNCDAGKGQQDHLNISSSSSSSDSEIEPKRFQPSINEKDTKTQQPIPEAPWRPW